MQETNMQQTTDTKKEDVVVSISCLCYNHGKYIRKALDGFVKQKTNFRFQVVIHDDASTDDSADIIREYATRYPDIFVPICQQENQMSQGIHIGRTFIRPLIKGKYVAFCECDDYWEDEHKLQRQYDILEAHPECSIAIHKICRINEDGTPYTGSEDGPLICPTLPPFDIAPGVLAEDFLTQCMWGTNFVTITQTNSYFLRREVYEASLMADLPYSGYLNGDESLFLTAMAMGRCYYDDRAMSCYRHCSAGSWNMRQRNAAKETVSAALAKNLVGLSRYDAYIDYRYHDLIMHMIALRSVDRMAVDPAFLDVLLPELGLSRRELLSHLHGKEKIVCFCTLHFPGLYKRLKNSTLLYRIYRRMG